MDPPLRTPSDRPTILVDSAGRALVDPAANQVGFGGPFGRERIVSALPLNGSPVPPVLRAELLQDSHGNYLVDSDTSLLGWASPWITRLVTPRPVQDTRRVG